MKKVPDHRAAPPRGPFPRPLRLREVPDAGLARSLDATDAECRAIAADLGFPAVASLHADLRVAARAGGLFEVTGTLEALLTQVCVVTLEPFESRLRQDVSMRFAQPSADQPVGGEIADVDLDHLDDMPDPIVDNTIDLGAVVLEFLVLACDPYPRKPGVNFNDLLVGEEEREPSPFAALGRLKDQT